MRRKKKTYRKIYGSMKTTEVNEILLNQYKYSLYNFAVSLAIVLNDYPIWGFMQIWEMKKAKIPGTADVKKEIERLLEVKSQISRLTKDLRRHLKKVPDWHQTRRDIHGDSIKQLLSKKDISDVQVENIMAQKLYKLEDTLKIIDDEIEYLEKSMWKPFRKGPGKAVEPGIIIHSFWSLVIRKNKNADMKNVRNLMHWFAEKLKTTAYGSKLNEKSPSPSIYRFISENREKLQSDRKLFFPPSDESDTDNPIFLKRLRVSFAQEEPKIDVYDPSCRGRKCKLVIFPDGTNFSDILK